MNRETLGEVDRQEFEEVVLRISKDTKESSIINNLLEFQRKSA